MFASRIRGFYSLLVLKYFFIVMLSFNGEVRAQVFNPKHFILKNGMQVILLERHRVPVVTHMIWYRVGSMDEESGKTGVAHFLEHLMFKGTKSRKPGEFSKIVSRNGGQENAFTSTNYTAYYQTISAKKLPLVMEMEADRMKNLVITEEGVNTERQVILEERRSRVNDNPMGLLSEQMAAALYLNHPYRNPVIGWEHEIKMLTLENIKNFYNRWYAPNNAILVVAGAINEQRLKKLAKKYYGLIPAKPLPKKNVITEPTHFASRRVVLKDEQIRHPSWRRFYLAPSSQWGDSKMTFALEILSDILGGGATSHLYKTLVIEKKLATSAGTYYSGDGRGPGRFMIFASPRQNVSLDTLEESIDKEISSIIKDGPKNSEIKRSKDRLLAAIVFARDSSSGSARSLGAAITSGLSIQEFESWPEKINLVTALEIRKAASIVFNKKKSVTGLLLPQKHSQ